VWQAARGGNQGFGRFDLTREVAAGLTFRPLAVTARDTLAYYHTQPEAAKNALSAGITPEREKQVLAEWHARTK
jgi:2'-hydroxyisoflavone reductase